MLLSVDKVTFLISDIILLETVCACVCGGGYIFKINESIQDIILSTNFM